MKKGYQHLNNLNYERFTSCSAFGEKWLDFKN
jgi:hypothetical protein